MKNKVFQFVLFYNPDMEVNENAVPQIIDQGVVIAPDQEKAKLLASRKLTADWDSKISDIEVLVRPF